MCVPDFRRAWYVFTCARQGGDEVAILTAQPVRIASFAPTAVQKNGVARHACSQDPAMCCGSWQSTGTRPHLDDS